LTWTLPCRWRLHHLSHLGRKQRRGRKLLPLPDLQLTAPLHRTAQNLGQWQETVAGQYDRTTYQYTLQPTVYLEPLRSCASFTNDGEGASSHPPQPAFSHHHLPHERREQVSERSLVGRTKEHRLQPPADRHHRRESVAFVMTIAGSVDLAPAASRLSNMCEPPWYKILLHRDADVAQRCFSPKTSSSAVVLLHSRRASVRVARSDASDRCSAWVVSQHY